jgi:hypothetical protein
MTMIAKLSLALAALALTAGSAAAQGDCAWKMRVAKAQPVAEATPVDVAALATPVLPPARATSVETVSTDAPTPEYPVAD